MHFLHKIITVDNPALQTLKPSHKCLDILSHVPLMEPVEGVLVIDHQVVLQQELLPVVDRRVHLDGDPGD